MTERLGNAVLELRTDDDAFERGIDRAKRKALDLAKTFDKVGKAARRIGTQLTAAISVPLTAIGVLAVKTASDVQEMRNLFKETFGEAAEDVEQWAERTAIATNRSRFDLMKTAAEFAAFLKPLGVAPAAVAPMSKALTQLTTDISSFRDQTEEEVFTRLFSGLAGETEAVRRLGIDIGEAAVQQELLNKGFRGSVGDATQSQKVMARFSLIMRQTTDAQGDAARTAESFQNQSRGLAAAIKNIRVEIGNRLLPIATSLASKITELGKEFLGLSENVKSGILVVAAFVAAIGPAIFAIGLLVQAIAFAIGGFVLLVPVLTFAGKAIKAVLIAVQVVVVGFLGFFSTVPGIIITSLAAIVGGFFVFKDTVVGFFKGLVLAIRDAFVVGFNNLVVIPFQKSVNKLSEFLLESPLTAGAGLKLRIGVNDILENTFSDDMKSVISEATTTGKREFEEFKVSASNAIDFVKTKFNDLAGAAAGVIPEFDAAGFSLENMGLKFQKLLSQLPTVKGSIGEVGDAAVTAGENATSAWEQFGFAIHSTVEDNLTNALTGVRRFADATKAILNEVISSIIRVGVVRPILSFFGIKGFADGGRPPVGRPSVVGERGPELFVPDSAGTIIPNHALGGGGGINQEFNFPIAFPTQLQAFIQNTAGPAGRDAAIQLLNAQRGRF
ncbi:MAG: hypothetical protein K0U72_04930 [Gammaproteobacteria bacterium]|nr:hypothetical protein [Gammaproteobacteria bacterium]